MACLGIIALSIFAVVMVRHVIETTDDSELDLATFQRSATGYIYALNADNPNASSEGDWEVYHTLIGDSNSIWVELSDIPKAMQDAAIATEDRDFMNHGGFSISRTFLAALNEIFHFRTQFGGSTLDQQLVKNITGEKEVGYERKLREIYRAWVLNKNYSKQIILEAYLNTMPLTSTIVGVKAGAYEYFYTENLHDLSLAQCAMIIGITNSPTRYNPYLNPDQCKERRDYVLYSMRNENMITEEEYQSALSEDLGLYTGHRETANDEVTSYFFDSLYEEVIADIQEKFGVTRPVASRYLYNSGWRIYATVDTSVQSSMEEVYYKGQGPQEDGYVFPDISAEVETADENGNIVTQTVTPQSAMVTIDYNGNLVGVVGGLGPKNQSLGQNRAVGSVRQVGSTMKAIGAYALGIEEGKIDYSSLIPDLGVKPNPSKPVRDEEGNLVNNWPQNVFNSGGKGDMIPVVDAVTVSLNTVAVRVGMRVGIEEMFDFMEGTLQISSLLREGAYTDLDYAPLVLGSMTYGISPLELTAAYQIFGNGGVYNSVHTYYQILDADGNVVMEPDRISIQAISPETAYIMTQILTHVFSSSRGSAGTGVNGTARGMGLSTMQSAAKTGTTTDDKDRWIVGYTPYYVSGVWWGYDATAALDWKTTPSINATTLCWNTVMEQVHENKTPKNIYDQAPSGIQEHSFCRESGQLATGACPDVQTGYYNVNVRVPGECFLHGSSGLSGEAA